jgi:uncharacterized protein
VTIPEEGSKMTAALVQQNKNLVLGALGAAQSGDIAAFLSALHQDVRLHEPDFLPYGGLYEGPESFLAGIGAAGSVLDVAKAELLNASADETRTVLLMAVPLLSTGECMHITEHWSVEDGLVTDVRVFWFEHPEFA